MTVNCLVEPQQIIHQIIDANGLFPNNPRLPLLIYKKTVKNSEKDLDLFEKIFSRNNWRKPWRDGIYPFHHYHSNTHEVLGICSGSCKIQFGGEGGEVFNVEKNDVLIIPAGVAHKNLGSTHDFLCIGAYPFDIQYDMFYGKPEDWDIATKNMQQVPLPKTDPVFGLNGPLFNYWPRV